LDISDYILEKKENASILRFRKLDIIPEEELNKNKNQQMEINKNKLFPILDNLLEEKLKIDLEYIKNKRDLMQMDDFFFNK